jgi:hypothetical protein
VISQLWAHRVVEQQVFLLLLSNRCHCGKAHRDYIHSAGAGTELLEMGALGDSATKVVQPSIKTIGPASTERAQHAQ